MKVSEVISRLQEIQAAEGDIELFTEIDGDYGDPISLTVDEEDGETFVTFSADLIEGDSEDFVDA